MLATDDVYHYGDAAANDWPHPDGSEGRNDMLSDIADELFYEGFLSLNYGPLDYNVQMIKSVQQEDLMNILHRLEVSVHCCIIQSFCEFGCLLRLTCGKDSG